MQNLRQFMECGSPLPLWRMGEGGGRYGEVLAKVNPGGISYLPAQNSHPPSKAAEGFRTPRTGVTLFAPFYLNLPRH